ncbi:hypothetical protein MBOE_16440 [Mycolicibacterium boenickei]|uniref:HNH endonuclease n=1 Tax=Mycolicibacterium boenickei TaxID=146017 RepID=A0ABM7IT63_9MYCO|nr:hypothetical protein MBOE_16440 [Mycolicibacterium boenickei]
MRSRAPGSDTIVDPRQLRLEVGHFSLEEGDERLRLTHICAGPWGQVHHRRRHGHRPKPEWINRVCRHRHTVAAPLGDPVSRPYPSGKELFTLMPTGV